MGYIYAVLLKYANVAKSLVLFVCFLFVLVQGKQRQVNIGFWKESTSELDLL